MVSVQLVPTGTPHYNHKMHFDKETHLLLKSFGVNLREVTYSGYKTFDGIPVAQKENDGYFMPEVIDSAWLAPRHAEQ